MSNLIISELMSFADRLKNDSRSSVLFEADYDVLQNAIAHIKEAGSLLDCERRTHAACAERLVYVKQERDELHAIVRQCLASLKNGSGATEECSIAFLHDAPNEISAVVQSLRTERDELAAQVEVMRMALTQVALSYQERLKQAPEYVVSALSITPFDALREVKARTLEHAADHERLYCVRDYLRAMAAAIRNGE